MRPKLFTPSYCCILLANFLLFFAFWMLIPLFPFYLKESYGVEEGAIGAILSCYTVSALMVRPFSGYLLETVARKPLYIMAYFLFTSLFAGYIVGGSLTFFIIVRILHGFTFGAVTVGGNTVVVDIMPSERRGEGLGYYGLTNNTAMSIGPMVGLFLHGNLSYQSIFGIGMAACLAGFVLACCVKLPAKPLKQGCKNSIPNSATIPNSRPAVSLDRFFLAKGIPAGIALLMLSMPYGATTNFVAMYVNEMGLKVPPGFFFVVMATGMGVSRIFSGKFVDRGYVTSCIHNGYYLVVMAFALLGCCQYIMQWNENAAAIAFFTVPLLQGVGFGIIFPAYNSLYINLAPNNRRATATSSYLTSWDVGIGLGITLGGYIAQYFSFSLVYITGGLLSLISMHYFDRIVTPHYRKYHLR